MLRSEPRRYELECHPATPRPPVRSLRVSLHREENGTLRLSYELEGHVARLRIPPLAAPRRTDDLWRHTCFEAFLAVEGGAGYRELNFSPSSQWAAYGFSGYREGMSRVEEAQPPRIAVRSSEYRLALEVHLAPAGFPELVSSSPLKLALTAVLEADDGTLSYWSAKHPPGKPDFHDAEGFVAVLGE
jgi:hypothetical protein